MTAPRPGAGTYLTPNAAADVAAAACADGGTPARPNTIRAGDIRNANQAMGGGHHHPDHRREIEMGPYRDKDVLLSLQLSAYFSKYPHCRQGLYKPRTSFRPATA